MSRLDFLLRSLRFSKGTNFRIEVFEFSNLRRHAGKQRRLVDIDGVKSPRLSPKTERLRKKGLKRKHEEDQFNLK